MSEVDAAPRRAPVVPSALAAAAIAVWILVVLIVGTVVQALSHTVTGGAWVPEALLFLVRPGNLISLAFVVGVFVSFWAVAPVVSRLTLPSLLARALIAAAVGAVTLFPAQLAFVLDYFATINEQNAAQGSTGLIEVGPPLGVPEALGQAAGDTLEYAIARLPLVVLAALGSWAWQRRSLHADA